MEYNDEQLRIINSEEPNLLIRANAGTGKTSTSIGAIVKYRQDHPRDRIDAITFTRAATNELRLRLSQEGVNDVNISTIHVWSRNFLQLYSELYHFELRLLYEPSIKDILTQIIAGYKKKVAVQPVYDFILNDKRINIPEYIKATYEALERRYIRYKREHNLYDFTDYPLYLYNVLEEYDEYIYDVDALFVDELQDIDFEQSHVFERVKSSKKFYIGDEKQMIYGFRGASSDIFDKMKDGFTTLTLYNNYRSKQEIINYATNVYNICKHQLEIGQKTVISDVQWGTPSEIKCMRGEGGSVWVVSPFGECFNGQRYVDTTSTIISLLNTRPQILCRTNKQVEMIKNAGYLQVSTIHQSKGLEYDNVIVIDNSVSSIEDVNVMYVGLTRAKNKLMVISAPLLLKHLPKSGFFIL